MTHQSMIVKILNDILLEDSCLIIDKSNMSLFNNRKGSIMIYKKVKRTKIKPQKIKTKAKVYK